MNQALAASLERRDPEAIPVRRAGNLFVELTKARLSTLVLATTAVGTVLASIGPIDGWRLLWTLAGTALAAFGANALNQVLEAPLDGRMIRTRNRPIPAGRIDPRRATGLALVLAAAGPVCLALLVNLLTAALALITIVIYVGVYTPLKRMTSLNTLMGAVCGAIPPMIGWAAVTGRLDVGAWVLGLLLFIWQIPHFLSLAWLYREDYARGGFRMLPVNDPSGRVTFHVTVLYALALLPLGPLAAVTGIAGWTAAIGTVLLGAGFLVLCLRLKHERTRASARSVFLASLLYLPLVLGLLVADRGPVTPGFRPMIAGAVLLQPAGEPAPLFPGRTP